jgi:flagellar biosynthetic protein FliP
MRLLKVLAAGAGFPLLGLGAATRGAEPAGAGTAMQVALLLAALSLLPALVMSVTPFLRITLVLHFLRQAIGTQTAPSNQALIALSLFLTMVLVEPVTARIHEDAWKPYSAGSLSAEQALEKSYPHVRKYLLAFAREKDLALMADLAHIEAPKSPESLPLRVLAPAYMLSEMRAGFQIGAVLFLPFIVIDLIVASVTLSIGMVQLPPAMVSAPFKILLFVLADGWNLLVGSLLRSFAR